MNHPTPAGTPPASSLLKLDQVTVWRENTRILDRIDLDIPVGRHTAILGPNGAGKTSLLKLLVRQFYPSIDDDGTQGRVSILGRSDWPVDQLRCQMGIVSQSLEHEFLSGRSGRMSVRDVIYSGFNATMLSAFGPNMTPAMKEAADHAAHSVGVDHLADRRLETLSTGERRRTLIARSLVHRPPVLVLDEPTSGLDLAARHQFLQTMLQMLQMHDLTLVLVTHALEEIAPPIGHVVLLDSGRIAFDGSKADALSSDRLSRLYGVPATVHQHAGGWYSASVG
ncbi:ABC transporter ATP-binding protein [Crateriforma conspicua]|uniref:Putative ABC transporter ATP-binding protein YlmA n=1 Tax=Crateriforma conspicua TaxID=2527996 RepID=A0A5C6FKJ4_9PLAN|nr:ATP-binding cassette domain-containing protein [Crateriforma conspicua]TWU61642.1 putative ABC transporter ATP-binding protein YlmA [Crateriforma conspicua]